MTRSRAPHGRTPREPRPICSRFVVSLTKPRPSKLEGERLLGTHHEAQRTNLTSASLDSHGHGTIVASHGRYRDGVEGAGHVKRQALIPIRRCTHTPSERDPSLQTQTTAVATRDTRRTQIRSTEGSPTTRRCSRRMRFMVLSAFIAASTVRPPFALRARICSTIS